MSRKYYQNNSSSSGGGVGILGVLQIIFIVLKLVDVIDWPWRTVLIPTWISLGLIAIAVTILIITIIVDNCKYN